MSKAFNDSEIETELQVRLMSLVMGEASDFERDQLQLLMEKRVDVAAYYTHLEHLHSLLCEVGAGDPAIDAEPSSPADAWQLSTDRRDRVLAVLDNQIPNPLTKVTLANKHVPKGWRITTSQVVAVASLACVLLVLMLPAVQSNRIAASRFNRDHSEVKDTPYYLNDDVQYFPERRARVLATDEPSTVGLYDSVQPSGNKTSKLYDWQQGITAGKQIESRESNVPSDIAAYVPNASGPNTPTVHLVKPGVPSAAPAATTWAANGGPQAGGVAGMNFGSAAFGNGFREAAIGGGTAGGEGGMPGGGGGREWGGAQIDSGLPAAIPAKPKPNGLGTGLGNTLYSALESPKSEITTWERSDFELNRTPAEVVLNGSSLPGLRSRYFNSALDDGFKSNSQDEHDASPTLMMTVTPKIVIPEEEDFEARRGENSKWYRQLPTDGELQAVKSHYWESDSLGSKVDAKKKANATMLALPRGGLLGLDLAEDAEYAVPEVSFEQDKEFERSLGLKGNRAPSPEKFSARTTVESLEKKKSAFQPPVTLDEQSASAEAFSTFSLHVSDVSFKLAQTALSQGQWPEAAKIRIEEFVNALDYHDPLPSHLQKVACRVEQAIHPFLMQRNLLRVSMRTAAKGRAQNTPLRLTLLLDNSGSMERPDRRQAVLRAFQTLAQQLNAADQVTLISFASTPRLLADKVPGNQGETLLQRIENLPSEGGTNLEAALLLAREKAAEQLLAGAQNRIVLLTDGAVNLGNANPESLSKLVTQLRDDGIAFDAAGISALDLNDEVLEALTRQGDGRYYLLDSAAAASEGFAAQIAGALRPSAQNVKVQVEFNPQRVGRYKLLGFDKHQLNKEDFRNDQVDAAEMAAAEAGVAVYQFEIKPNGSGDVGSVSVRFRDLSTGQMVERRWPIPYESNTPRLEQAQASMQLAASAALFAAKLGGGPLADNVDLAQLQSLLAKLPEQVASQLRVQQLRAMIDQAKAIGK